MLRVRAARAADVPAIFALIGELADYERLRHQMVGRSAPASSVCSMRCGPTRELAPELPSPGASWPSVA